MRVGKLKSVQLRWQQWKVKWWLSLPHTVMTTQCVILELLCSDNLKKKSAQCSSRQLVFSKSIKIRANNISNISKMSEWMKDDYDMIMIWKFTWWLLTN